MKNVIISEDAKYLAESMFLCASFVITGFFMVSMFIAGILKSQELVNIIFYSACIWSIIIFIQLILLFKYKTMNYIKRKKIELDEALKK